MRAKPLSWPSHFCVFMPHGMRENGTVSLRVMADRLSRAGLGHFAVFYDLRNASGSTKLEAAVAEVFSDEGQKLLLDRLHNSACEVPTLPTPFVIVCLAVARPKVDKRRRSYSSIFVFRRQCWIGRPTCPVTCTVHGAKVDGSVCAFADDLARVLAVEPETAVRAASLACTPATNS